jgi:hypothetical protein
VKAKKTKRVVAYEIVDRKTEEVVHRMPVQDKGERHADKVFEGLCQKVDYERFGIRTVRG